MKSLHKIWTPNIEHDDDGFLNDCLPQDDFDLETVETLEAASVSFSTVYMSGDMPIIKWDPEFEAFIDRRGSQIEEMMREIRTLPLQETTWRIRNRQSGIVFLPGTARRLAVYLLTNVFYLRQFHSPFIKINENLQTYS